MMPLAATAAPRSTLAAQVASQAARGGPALVQGVSQGPAKVIAGSATPATPVTPPNSPAPPSARRVLAPGQLSTPELFTRLRSSTTALRNSMIEISYLGWQLHVRGDWASIDLADEDAAREELGLGETLWRTYMILGERLVASGLTLEQLRSLTVESARLLTRINPALWQEHNWIQEARLLPSQSFAALIDSRNAEVPGPGGKSGAGAGSGSRSSAIKVSVPRREQSQLENRIRRLRQSRSLGSNGAALEAALTAAEHEQELRAKLTGLVFQVDSLAGLWPADPAWSSLLSESAAERAARFSGDPAPQSLLDAAHTSQRLVAQLKEDLHALLG